MVELVRAGFLMNPRRVKAAFFNVLDVGGTPHSVSTIVLDADGTPYEVLVIVLDADGTEYSVL